VKLRNLLYKIFKFIKKVVIYSFRNDLLGISGEIAFYGAFSLFPVLISIVAILSMFAKDPSFYLGITSFMYSSLPGEVAEFLNYNLKNLAMSSTSTQALIIGLIVTVWTTSNVILSFIKGINRAYKVKETRSFLQLRRLSISLVFSIGFLLITAFLLIVFGESYTNWFLSANFLVIPDDTVLRLNFLRWSFVLIILSLLSIFLYYKAPNIKHRIITVIPGAVFFAPVWIIATTIFGTYLNSFPTYNATYGTLGTMIILLLWIYITAFIFLVGSQINAILHPEFIPSKYKQMIKFIKRILSKI